MENFPFITDLIIFSVKIIKIQIILKLTFIILCSDFWPILLQVDKSSLLAKFCFIDFLSDQIVSFSSRLELVSCLLSLVHSHSISTRWRRAPMMPPRWQERTGIHHQPGAAVKAELPQPKQRIISRGPRSRAGLMA